MPEVDGLLLLPVLLGAVVPQHAGEATRWVSGPVGQPHSRVDLREKEETVGLREKAEAEPERADVR